MSVSKRFLMGIYSIQIGNLRPFSSKHDELNETKSNRWQISEEAIAKEERKQFHKYQSMISCEVFLSSSFFIWSLFNFPVPVENKAAANGK